ncbi:hypothetical protein BDP27DRAFT_1345782 [Rhodocollybia butyracea]|uniref:Uncharacterized protein n=1 Tax=Rhodocollybia butyracea TaxID=206335 RepID=A0A9P5TXW5_9AGAR|nr:hypothetical protein BDP27DRAFT_1345782 [Rhodocollybia butyracea]
MVYSRSVITAIFAAGAVSSVLAVPVPTGPPTALSPPGASPSLTGLSTGSSTLVRRGLEDGKRLRASSFASSDPGYLADEEPQNKKPKKTPEQIAEIKLMKDKKAGRLRKGKLPTTTNEAKQRKKEDNEKWLAEHPKAKELADEKKAIRAKKQEEKKQADRKKAAEERERNHRVKQKKLDRHLNALKELDSKNEAGPEPNPPKRLQRRDHDYHHHHHYDFSVLEEAVERVDLAKERLRAAKDHLDQLLFLVDEGEFVSKHRLHKAKHHLHQAKHRLRVAQKHLQRLEHEFDDERHHPHGHHYAHHYGHDHFRIGKSLTLASLGPDHHATPPLVEAPIAFEFAIAARGDRNTPSLAPATQQIAVRGPPRPPGPKEKELKNAANINKGSQPQDVENYFPGAPPAGKVNGDRVPSAPVPSEPVPSEQVAREQVAAKRVVQVGAGIVVGKAASGKARRSFYGEDLD